MPLTSVIGTCFLSHPQINPLVCKSACLLASRQFDSVIGLFWKVVNFVSLNRSENEIHFYITFSMHCEDKTSFFSLTCRPRADLHFFPQFHSFKAI